MDNLRVWKDACQILGLLQNWEGLAWMLLRACARAPALVVSGRHQGCRHKGSRRGLDGRRRGVMPGEGQPYLAPLKGSPRLSPRFSPLPPRCSLYYSIPTDPGIWGGLGGASLFFLNEKHSYLHSHLDPPRTSGMSRNRVIEWLSGVHQGKSSGMGNRRIPPQTPVNPPLWNPDIRFPLSIP